MSLLNFNFLIGLENKWSFLLAAFLVMGGAVWSYFLTVSPNQSTYAPVVMIGSGLSVMYVMALVFITELIGENKVGVTIVKLNSWFFGNS